MSTKFVKMDINQSPWVNLHDREHVKNYNKYFQSLAVSIVDLLDDGDTRTSGPFLTGAQQSVERYNITTRAHSITKSTTFRFSELKDGDKPVTIFIIPDVSRLEAQRPVMEILQYCLLQEMKRHKNKHAIVHYIADEVNNFKIKNLDSLLTWSRGYGLRFQLYIQNFPSFREMYGKNALATLLSETEIKLYLPGTREPETRAIIEKELGNRSLIAVGRSSNTETRDYWIGGTDYREDGRVLMDADEIRRTDKAILIIRRNKPLLVDLPPIAAIAPFRDIIDINPFHGKPFLMPVELTLDRDNPQPPTFLQRLLCHIPKKGKRELWERKIHLSRMARLSWAASRLVESWGVILIVIFISSPIGPHLRWSYQYQHSSGNAPRYYISCNYFGSRGLITPDLAPHCPLLVFIDSRDWRR